MNQLDYNVIATGSTGNAVRIEDIMIDCGITFERMKDDLYKVDTLLITHSHTDHIKEATLNKIRKNFPKIKVYANYDVAYQYDVDVVIGTSLFELPRKRMILPITGVHDVPVTGFVIFMKKLNILYMTDTCRVTLPEEIPLDYVFLESNYDEVKIGQRAKAYKRHGYDPLENSIARHLSTQKCREFYFVNRRDENSKLIELHQSSRFY